MSHPSSLCIGDFVSIMIVYARIQKTDLLEVCLQHDHPGLSIQSVTISPHIKILNIQQQKNLVYIQTSPFDLTQAYSIRIEDSEERPVQPDGVLDALFSEKELGHSRIQGKHVFRVFAPRARWAKLVLFRSTEDRCDRQIDMKRMDDGTWEVGLQDIDTFLYYGYRLDGPDDETELFDPSVILADPYSKAVATRNHFLHPARTLLHVPEDFDWEGDQRLSLSQQDLIIYEMHVRDMTLHASSGIARELRGTYLGLTADKGPGGLQHLLRMGVNCVELMPVQEFGNIEVDYKNEDLEIYNDWNVYERNHWGYMTSYFFAPESYYATGANLKPNQVIGEDGRAVTELKSLVKTLHQNGIAVIMDVVYNHVSQYDLNPLKYIDKKYYFRLDKNQHLLSESGCGNDFKTERPMARKLMIDSLLYWMKEFHIDGFRFDLAVMIDDGTLKELTETLRAVHPNVILIAEPWGGGRYDLQKFSRLGWGAWNDIYRNSIKGENPHNGLGLIFGYLWGGKTDEDIKSCILGSKQSKGGPFLDAAHSVNYLESHDDYSLGDFIRIGLKETLVDQPVKDLEMHARLSSEQMKIHKLAALILMTSQGPVMMHAGQEFGRSKVIAKVKLKDAAPGFIDVNSYNKDDETNWINYDHMKYNQELVDYYAGLIAIRRNFSCLRRADEGHFHFMETSLPMTFLYQIRQPGQSESLVMLNCHSDEIWSVKLPQGKWHVLVNEHKAWHQPLQPCLEETVNINPGTGMVVSRSLQ